MKNQPTVSVLILCYNYGHLLEKTLNACAEQTFRDFEIVMINNGSTDNTEEVYKSFCRAHPNVRTVYVDIQPNRGPSGGWNSGLEAAHGEYIMFIDADDWMDPDCLEKLVAKARETGADRVAAQFREVTPDGKVLRDRPFPKPGRYGQHKIPLGTGAMQGTIYRRALVEENRIRFQEEPVLVGGQDAWFNCKYMLVENKFALVRQTLYNYYRNPESLTVHIVNKWTCEDYFSVFSGPVCIRLGDVLAESAGTGFAGPSDGTAREPIPELSGDIAVRRRGKEERWLRYSPASPRS